jgi:hypothetical protein
MNDGQKRIESKRLAFAFKNGLDYYLPENRMKLSDIDK